MWCYYGIAHCSYEQHFWVEVELTFSSFSYSQTLTSSSLNIHCHHKPKHTETAALRVQLSLTETTERLTCMLYVVWVCVSVNQFLFISL